jgi:hypothetical protein
MFSHGEWNHAAPHDVDGTNWMFSLGEWNHLTALGIAAAFPAITDAAALARHLFEIAVADLLGSLLFTIRQPDRRGGSPPA